MMKLAPLDIIFGILILIAVVRCALRGLVAELMSWAAVVCGVLFSFLLYKRGAVLIRERFFSGQVLPEILAFAALFLIVFISVKILEYILRDIVNRIKLGGVDRFLGALFGILEGLCVVTLILFIISVQPLFDPRVILSDSFFARLLSPFITVVQEALIRSQGVPPMEIPNV